MNKFCFCFLTIILLPAFAFSQVRPIMPDKWAKITRNSIPDKDAQRWSVEKIEFLDDKASEYYVFLQQASLQNPLILDCDTRISEAELDKSIAILDKMIFEVANDISTSNEYTENIYSSKDLFSFGYKIVKGKAKWFFVISSPVCLTLTRVTPEYEFGEDLKQHFVTARNRINALKQKQP